MRPKFVFAMLLSVLLVLGAIFLLKQHLGNASTSAFSSSEITPISPPASNAVTSVTPPSAPVPASTNTLTPEQRREAIDAETDRLQQLSMNDDPASLSAILNDLTNPEKEIRAAAIEAAKQFGSTNAIPTLKAVASKTDDTGEQIALLEAADFLALPSFTIGGSGSSTPKTPEQIQADEQQRAQAEARRQAHLQKHAGNRNSQSTPDQNPPAAPNN